MNYDENSKDFGKRNHLTNKHICIIEGFNDDGTIKGQVIKTVADRKGKLYKGNCPVPLNPGNYYFYVSDKEAEDINKITKYLCTDEIEITDEFEQLIELPINYRYIGNDHKGKPMYVRVYGSGIKNTAIFFIGGIHGNEFGGIWSLHLMEDFIEMNENIFNYSVNLFFLNPVHNLRQIENPQDEKRLSIYDNRFIIGKDPNRNFLAGNIPEVKNIINFTDYLINNYSKIIIISAHSFNDNKEGRPYGNGVICPNFNLTASGKHKLSDDRAKPIRSDGIKIDSSDYVNPEDSILLAREFERLTGFVYSSLWDNEIYDCDYMLYLKDKKVIMIEFETPQSLTYQQIQNKWRRGYEDFIRSLLWWNFNEAV